MLVSTIIADTNRGGCISKYAVPAFFTRKKNEGSYNRSPRFRSILLVLIACRFS